MYVSHGAYGGGVQGSLISRSQHIDDKYIYTHIYIYNMALMADTIKEYHFVITVIYNSI